MEQLKIQVWISWTEHLWAYPNPQCRGRQADAEICGADSIPLFLHQRLSWLVLFLTVEVNCIIHYIILYTSYFLSKSCLNHCALYGDSKQLWLCQFCMQTCFCCFFICSGYFFSQFVQILQFLAGWLLPWDVAKINAEFLSSADLHVTEGLLVIQVLRLSISVTLHWMIFSAYVSHILTMIVILSIKPCQFSHWDF